MRCVSRRLRELRGYNEDRAREDKVEKADEKMIMENGPRRDECNRAVKQKGTERAAKRGAERKIKTQE